jgi:hypothetical protein
MRRFPNRQSAQRCRSPLRDGKMSRPRPSKINIAPGAADPPSEVIASPKMDGDFDCVGDSYVDIVDLKITEWE